MFDERELIISMKEGEEDAFRRLYDRYVGELWHFVYRYVKSEAVTDEIVQDTFTRLWLNKTKVDENRSLRPYIFKISYNQLLKEFRRTVRNPLIGDYMDFAGNIADRDRELYDLRFYMKLIQAAKNTLTPRQREIFELNKEIGMTPKEIAAELGLGEQVVRNQISISVRHVKEHIFNTLKNDYKLPSKKIEILMLYISTLWIYSI